MVKFLSEKNIAVQSLKGYIEVVQLREVNNKIKHSDNYESSLSSIGEFKSSDELTYNKLDQFYNRIKESPHIFLRELISAVYNELYKFDDNKIGEIAKSFVLRMDRAEALSLAKEIMKHY